MAGEILAQLPDDLRTNEAFTGMNTAGDLGEALVETKTKYSDLEKKITTDYIPKLREDATDEQKSAYYKELGVPERSDDYEIPVPEGREPPDQRVVQWMQNTFHGAHLTKEQATFLRAEFNSFGTAFTQAIEQEAQGKLKAELGDKYDASVALATKFWTDFDKVFNGETSVNRFLMVRVLLKLAHKTGEDMSSPSTPSKGSEEPNWFPNTDFKST